MHQPADESARAAWCNQPDAGGDVDSARARAAAEKRDAEIRRRDRVAYACGAVIAPAWAAAMWFMPDLRLVAAIGFAVAVWITFQTYRRSAARLESDAVGLACATFQRALLERERDLYLAMPKVLLVPIVLSQVAILFALFTNARFPRSAAFPFLVAAFVGTVVTALVVARRHWRQEAAKLQSELDALNRSVTDR